MAAIGIIETRGFTSAVEALDTMCKDAKVEVNEMARPGGGHITLIIEGEVSAVKSAVDAGVAAAERLNADIICINVIPNPHEELVAYLKKEMKRIG